MDKKIANKILWAITVAISVGMLFVPPIAQTQSYHQFADTNSLLGVPNAWNVLSNIPFLLVGVQGLHFCWQHRSDNFLVVVYSIFFGGIFLTGFGSGYYHLAPNNQTLVWDRLPMTLGFMALFCAVLTEWIDRRFRYSLWLFLLIGIFSVWYWAQTDDLRLYALVQFLPMVLLVLIIWLYESPFNEKRALCFALGWYVLAKVLEAFDSQVYSALGFISGHALKHIAAAVTPFVILHMLKKRQVQLVGHEKTKSLTPHVF